LESLRKQILEQIKEIRESITEEQLKEASGEDLVNYLMEVHRLESLLMTTIDDYTRDIK